MQKVRYSLGINSLYIKFQYYFTSEVDQFSPFIHITVYYRNWDFLALEVDPPIFVRISTFYGLL